MLFLVVTAAAEINVSIAVFREEIIGGEFDFFENVAGLVGGIVALLFGYAKVVYGDKHLYLTDKLNNGKESKRYVDGRCAAVKTRYNATAQKLVYEVRHNADTLARVLNLANTTAKRDGVNTLNNAFWHIGCAFGLGVTVVLVYGIREYTDVAVATAQDHTFVVCSNALYLYGTGVGCHIDVKINKEQKG